MASVRFPSGPMNRHSSADRNVLSGAEPRIAATTDRVFGASLVRACFWAQAKEGAKATAARSGMIVARRSAARRKDVMERTSAEGGRERPALTYALRRRRGARARERRNSSSTAQRIDKATVML